MPDTNGMTTSLTLEADMANEDAAKPETATPTLRITFNKPMHVADPVEHDLYWSTWTEVAADVITHDGADSVFWLAGTEQRRYPTEALVTVEIHVQVPSRPKTYTVEKAREEHPQAYARWTADDDASLLERQQAGVPVDDLAAEFGRKPSAIRSRLGRLLAPDASQ